MKLGIMQPYFFPYIGYWQILNYVDTYIVYDDVNFIKGGWINRNYILEDGEKSLLTLQLKKASPNKLISEIEVGNNQKKIMKTISQLYSKAPFFNSATPLIEEILFAEQQNLGLFLLNSIHKIAGYLGIKTNIILSSTLDKDNSLKGQEKILEICNKTGATTYVNAPGGIDLYELGAFKMSNIELYFLKATEVVYPQFNNYFVKNLSILDVLMFNSPDDISNHLLKFELVK